MPDYNNSGQGRASRKPVPAPRQPMRPSESGHMPSSADNKQQRQAKKLLMNTEQMSILRNNLRIAGLYINSRHLEMLTPAQPGDLYESEVEPLVSGDSRDGIAVFQITKLMYNEDENSFEKLVSLYSALNSFGGIAAMIIQSDGKITNLYLCTNTSGNGRVAGRLLSSNLKGQFPGCELTSLNDSDKNRLLDSFGKKGSFASSRTVRSLSMIPSRREDERTHDREYSAQGYEKFIDAMNGQKYTLVVLSQRVSPDAMDECREGLEAMFTSLSPYAKETSTFGENQSDSVNYSISNNISNSISRSVSRSFGTSHTSSISHGRSTNSGSGYELFDVHFNNGSGTSSSTSYSTGTNTSSSDSSSSSDTYGSGDSQSSGTTTGVTRSLTINRDNKAVQNLLAKIEEHIKRINMSQTFGMWNTACYMIADDPATATMGTSTLAALFSGDSVAAPRCYCNQWDATSKNERDQVLNYISNLQHPVINLTMIQEIENNSGSISRTPFRTEKITPAMMISGKEIPTIMGMPRKSVAGIVVDSMAEFGRNIPEKWKNRVKRPILFGNIYHMGQIEDTQTYLDLDAFASHMFICGSSGSGKSNTTYNLLQKLIDNKIPFLVIEPAKGEYKIEFAELPGVNIFTADDSAYRRLQINPFEFNQGIHIREHLDHITQAIMACWPLYGAMPGLLKQAFEKIYLDHGWDLDHSERIVNRGSKFPVFADLVTALEKIIDESPYSNQSKGDYKGALLNRVSSLCNGFEGAIFGESVGIPDSTLFNKRTIIDLSSIGSDETRSLIMGILIIKLQEYRKATVTSPNSPLQHVTVLEEAHNILKRCSHEQSADSGNSQGQAVESLCRAIAEMRSKGEGFMIIDQSPGAVDAAAIRNTAIKIAMRLPSKDDCEEIGAALSLNENQIRELSRLDIGVAAIFHAGWTDTVLAKMGDIWDKRYRAKTPVTLNDTSYTRMQGAILQLLYHKISTSQYYDIYDDVNELIEQLNAPSGGLIPPLPLSKQQEMLESVRIFLDNNNELIRAAKRRELMSKYYDFVFDFLHLTSVMKIFPLNRVNDKFSTEPLSAAETREVRKWEKQIREGYMRYLNMPAEAEPLQAYRWPADPSGAQYFWRIYEGTLTRWTRSRNDKVRYENAIAYLRSAHVFKK